MTSFSIEHFKRKSFLLVVSSAKQLRHRQASRSLLAAKSFAVALLATSVIGCADGADYSDFSAVQSRDANALEKVYSGIQGTWEGTVANASAGLVPFQGELKLYVNYVQDGVNPDGRPKLRPTLRGRFQPKDFYTETDYIELGGDFDRSGRLLLVAQKSLIKGEEVRTFVIRGTIQAGNAVLELSRQGGVWGVLTARRVSEEASAPATGLEGELRERALRQYREIEGVYNGLVKTIDGNDYKSRIILTVVERPGSVAPEIRAQYVRLDAPAGTLEWSMSVSYNAQTRELIMRDDQPSMPGSPPGGMLLSITGFIKDIGSDRVLDARITGKAGLIGTLQAVRVKQPN